MLRDLMRYYKVPLYLECATTSVTKNGVEIKTKDGQTQIIPADDAIVSIGYIAGTPYEIEDRNNVHVIGDAAIIGNLRTVVWAADDLVRELSE